MSDAVATPHGPRQTFQHLLTRESPNGAAADPRVHADLELLASVVEQSTASVVITDTGGHILYVNPAAGWLFRSCDSGATWTRESVQVRPDGFGNIPKTEGVAAMQCGITLAFGKPKGRVIMPAWVMGPQSSNAVE